jgi:hypothetical protein
MLHIGYCSARGGEDGNHQVCSCDTNDLQRRDTSHYVSNSTSLLVSSLAGVVCQVSSLCSSLFTCAIKVGFDVVSCKYTFVLQSYLMLIRHCEL